MSSKIKIEPADEKQVLLRKQTFITAWRARRSLYLQGFTTEAEDNKIVARLRNYVNKYKIECAKDEL